VNDHCATEHTHDLKCKFGSQDLGNVAAFKHYTYTMRLYVNFRGYIFQ
jgi:hypothetical protein